MGRVFDGRTARLTGRVAFVSGGASGIGRAVARHLGRLGVRVGILDRDLAGLEDVHRELTGQGAECAIAQADVCNRDQVTQAVDALEAALGSVDIIVACAGITDVTLLDDLNTDGTEKLLAVNLLGVVRTVEAVLPRFLQRGSGQIVGISSLTARRGLPFTAAYCASKAGLAAYLEAIRSPLRLRGIAVCVVYAGYVRTPLTDRGRVKPPLRALEPEDAARHIVTAIAKRSRVCSFPRGQACACWLLRMLPAGVYDRLMTRAATRIKDLKY